MRLTAKTLAGVVISAALGLAGCQAVPERSDPTAEPVSAPVPAAVPRAAVLEAVRAATTLRDLPPSVDSNQLLAASGDNQEYWSVEGCRPTLEESRLDDIEPCILGDTTSERTMVLIGDSGAAQWHQAVDLIGKRNGWRAIVLAKSNCGPAALTYYQYQLKRAYTECDAWQDWRMEIIHREKAEIVVMTGWYDGGNQGPGRYTSPEIWRDGLVKTIERLPAGAKVFLLGGAPQPPDNPSECAADNPTDLTRCAMPAAEVMADQTPWAQAAEQTGGTFIDVDPLFCAEVCPAVIAENLVYVGLYHITAEYAQYLSGSIEEAMVPALTAPR